MRTILMTIGATVFLFFGVGVSTAQANPPCWQPCMIECTMWLPAWYCEHTCNECDQGGGYLPHVDVAEAEAQLQLASFEPPAVESQSCYDACVFWDLAEPEVCALICNFDPCSPGGGFGGPC